MHVRLWLSYQKINHNLNVLAFELGKSLSPEWAPRKDLRSAALCCLYFKSQGMDTTSLGHFKREQN